MPQREHELSPDQIADRLRSGLGDALEDLVVVAGQVTALVAAESWTEAARFVKEDPVLGCTFFSWLSAIDWSEEAVAGDETLGGEQEVSGSDQSEDGAENAEATTGSAGEGGAEEGTGARQGEYRQPEGELFQVMTWVSAPERGHGLLLKANLEKESAKIATLTGVYQGANWHERECAEMFGIEFEGHPNPEKLYLPDEFEGHPLLKAFKLGAREVKPWPGIVDVEEIPEALEAVLDARARSEEPS